MLNLFEVYDIGYYDDSLNHQIANISLRFIPDIKVKFKRTIKYDLINMKLLPEDRQILISYINELINSKKDLKNQILRQLYDLFVRLCMLSISYKYHARGLGIQHGDNLSVLQMARILLVEKCLPEKIRKKVLHRGDELIFGLGDGTQLVFMSMILLLLSKSLHREYIVHVLDSIESFGWEKKYLLISLLQKFSTFMFLVDEPYQYLVNLYLKNLLFSDRIITNLFLYDFNPFDVHKLIYDLYPKVNMIGEIDLTSHNIKIDFAIIDITFGEVFYTKKRGNIK